MFTIAVQFITEYVLEMRTKEQNLVLFGTKNFRRDMCGHFFFLLSIFITIIPHKIFEINSSFHVKQHTMGNVKFLLLISFLPVLKKKIILGERLRTTKIFLIIPNFLSS